MAVEALVAVVALVVVVAVVVLSPSFCDVVSGVVG